MGSRFPTGQLFTLRMGKVQDYHARCSGVAATDNEIGSEFVNVAAGFPGCGR
ncbi:hypothetical protein MPRG_61640 (plasmid) [Mycobacterium paragordonae]|uniref:Uncharacterized protein n=1 Tax=Mycobacterium paragordonae TaxID=1389713 RepID=A0ABQ1CEI7_9MYCO|nr:hypothetical protein MPRG_61640 [Mycobacterium paragordonae]